MDENSLTKLIFHKAKENNIEEIEVYIVKNSSMSFNIYEGNLEDYRIAEESALSLRGIYKGRMGYSYSEKLAEDSIDELIKNLIQYAENNESKDVETFENLSGQPQKSEDSYDKLFVYTNEQKIDYMKSIEKEAFALDKRISVVNLCSYKELTKSIIIKNIKGFGLETTHSMGFIGLSVVAKDGRDVQTGYSHLVISDLSEEYKSKLVQNAVYDSVNMLGASTINSGKYNVILRNNVAADMFSFMSPIFLGSVVQKNLSMLKGKIGQKVGANSLNILDSPLLTNAKFYRTFDDEGVKTYSKYIVENGILKTFLYNIKTAKNDGVESTGNGFRISHKNSIDVLPTNMYIEEGKLSLDEMIDSMNNGIIITDIDGLHAGINTVSGDFSLLSNGYFIKNGRIDKPICQVTISGNFYEMLMDITMIGNDTAFCLPEMNYFGSPSLQIKCLTIAGK